MPTFLELAQKVGSESGTVSGNQLTTVVATNDRLRKIVRWTNDAYRQIQNAQAGWRWLQDDFTAPMEAGTGRYSPATLGLTRFGEWVCTQDGREDRFSVYDTATGQAGEYPIVFQDWSSFYVTRLRGLQTSGRPRFFSITPAGEIVVSPTPESDFTLRGPYRKGPQELTQDTDVPEMPARFHDIIVDGALVMLTTHDEAAPTLSLYQLRQLRGWLQLMRDQLPAITFAGTLA